MANHASSKKRIRQTFKRTARNKQVRTFTRTTVKRVRVALEKGDKAEAQVALNLAMAQIDKAVSKGVYKRNTGSRYISRLAAAVAAA